MAASAPFSYVGWIPSHICVKRDVFQHVRLFVQSKGRVDHRYLQAKKNSMWFHRVHTRPVNIVKCQSVYGWDEDSEASFDEGDSKEKEWKLLRKRLKAFRGKIPQGEAAEQLQALVEKLEGTADPKNPQMQFLLGQAKRFLRTPRASLAHYLNLVRNAEATGHPQLGAWCLETGHACREAGDLEGALHFCSKGLEEFMDRFGPGSLPAAQARCGLSKAYFGLARYEDALREGKQAMLVLQKSGGLDEVISLTLTLADTLFYLKRYDEMVSILEEIISKTNGVVNANVHITTAKAFHALGRNGDAAVHCTKVLDVLQHQEPSPDVAAHYVMLASLYEHQEDYDHTAEVLTKSIKMYEKFPQNSPQDFVAELEGKLGRVLLRIKNAEEALPYLQRHLSKKKASLSSVSSNKKHEGQELLHAHYYLGAAYSQCEKFHTSLEHFEACMTLLSDVCREENPSFAMTIYHNAASMYYHVDRLDRAIQCQQAAVDVIKKNNLQENSVTRRIQELLEEYLAEAK
ncbi:hypothetical protein KP509_31G044600 [Ceratopteris richardii]|uniref:Uncharacterized protein n=1 Tax=Ceratopteris richardii TaxID=49495 RepID=A0A8T2QZJ7_CERRI|nr:hypothetical protein KP509_31G044600 [Ceratopteris richardii]